jgi:hypothetical protein
MQCCSREARHAVARVLAALAERFHGASRCRSHRTSNARAAGGDDDAEL